MNNIDRIMDEQPPLSEADYLELIAYHRSFRDEGVKPQREKAPKLEMPSLVSLGLIKAKEPAPPMKRRI